MLRLKSRILLLVSSISSTVLGSRYLITEKFHMKGGLVIEGWLPVILGYAFLAIGFFSFIMIFFVKKLISDENDNST